MRKTKQINLNENVLKVEEVELKFARERWSSNPDDFIYIYMTLNGDERHGLDTLLRYETDDIVKIIKQLKSMKETHLKALATGVLSDEFLAVKMSHRDVAIDKIPKEMAGAYEDRHDSLETDAVECVRCMVNGIKPSQKQERALMHVINSDVAKGLEKYAEKMEGRKSNS